MKKASATTAMKLVRIAKRLVADEGNNDDEKIINQLEKENDKLESKAIKNPGAVLDEISKIILDSGVDDEEAKEAVDIIKSIHASLKMPRKSFKISHTIVSKFNENDKAKFELAGLTADAFYFSDDGKMKLDVSKINKGVSKNVDQMAKSYKDKDTVSVEYVKFSKIGMIDVDEEEFKKSFCNELTDKQADRLVEKFKEFVYDHPELYCQNMFNKFLNILKNKISPIIEKIKAHPWLTVSMTVIVTCTISILCSSILGNVGELVVSNILFPIVKEIISGKNEETVLNVAEEGAETIMKSIKK